MSERDNSTESIHIVGGGLAGCEAALQLARLGLPCVLHEMRPHRTSPAHRGNMLAEIVCSNSLKSTAEATAQGLLKAELDLLGCRLLEIARTCAVPAGSALAVDREAFAAAVTESVENEPLIDLCREEITDLPASAPTPWILATGPLTSESLQESVALLTGSESLFFFDAIAPTVTLESLDLDRLYRAARYDRGDADYLNSPLDETLYTDFVSELVAAERIPVADFDRDALFAGCQPVEEIAASGPRSLAFGPLRPVGLNDPRTGERPHAVVQLRQENAEGTLFGLVGFQTRLRYGEQRRVFRMLPGLEGADFVRLGQMHRNFYLDSPRVLDTGWSLKTAPHLHLAGQITGVEGYVESIASGLLTAWSVAAKLRGIVLPPLPRTTMTGALLSGFLLDATSPAFSPMNANFGLLPPVPGVRGKRDRKVARAQRSVADLEAMLRDSAISTLLAAAATT